MRRRQILGQQKAHVHVPVPMPMLKTTRLDHNCRPDIRDRGLQTRKHVSRLQPKPPRQHLLQMFAFTFTFMTYRGFSRLRELRLAVAPKQAAESFWPASVKFAVSALIYGAD